MQVLAHYFLPLEDPKQLLDRGRIFELILFHEIGEIETGDILFHHKGEKQAQEERRAAGRVASQLPASMQSVAHERFLEFDACATPEAQFTDAIDKIEPIFELFEEKAYANLKVNGVTLDIGVNGKRAATEKYPHMRKFLDVWTRYIVSKNAFAE
jgi:putative hydrolase of HD superfamily